MIGIHREWVGRQKNVCDGENASSTWKKKVLGERGK